MILLGHLLDALYINNKVFLFWLLGTQIISCLEWALEITWLQITNKFSFPESCSFPGLLHICADSYSAEDSRGLHCIPGPLSLHSFLLFDVLQSCPHPAFEFSWPHWTSISVSCTKKDGSLCLNFPSLLYSPKIYRQKAKDSYFQWP